MIQLIRIIHENVNDALKAPDFSLCEQSRLANNPSWRSCVSISDEMDYCKLIGGCAHALSTERRRLALLHI